MPNLHGPAAVMTAAVCVILVLDLMVMQAT